MDFTRLCAAVSGRALGPRPSALGFSGVCIDSRKVKPGDLFVALVGSAQDGHDYVEAAFKAGALCALVEEAKLEDPALALEEKAARCGGLLIVVKDSLRALQDAAMAYLEQFPRLIKIGITGSSGKTTTKEIAGAIFGREKKTVTNPMNLNSETGLPLAVFDVREFHEVGIFEMGMNRKGEIAELARVLKPHIALITNVGTAHIGKIGSLEGIALEKKDIFMYQRENDLALIPGSCAFRSILTDGLKGKKHFYGPETLEELGPVEDRGLLGSEITWAGEKVRFALPGKHNLADALAAVALAKELSVGNNAIRQGLESVRSIFGRSEILDGTLPVIRDCYNAHPESAAAAVAFCDGLEYPGRKIYVLGSMLELGESSAAAHRELGLALAQSAADKVFLFGEEMEEAATELAKGELPFFHSRSIDELSVSLGDYVKPGDLVLVKGSRGCALERLDPVLELGAVSCF
jgi:UDP-N-acetylmuramoyl-tripeptide--D-alanyl-D-alanine ligase